MRTRGVTLIELVTAMVLAGILLLVMTCQFIANQNFTKAVNNRTAAAQETAVIMHHITRTLRFARSDLAVSKNDGRYASSISFTIEGTHLTDFPAGARLEYALDAGKHQLVYINPAPMATPVVIATDVTNFTVDYAIPQGFTNYEFVITLTITKGDQIGSQAVATTTTIHALP